MKTHMKVPVLALVLFSTLIPQLPTCFAQGTAFTYQASLAEDGAAANGVYDLRFRLFPSSAGGLIALAAVSLEDVGVTNGLFTVSLDFGSSLFGGSDRWLEIGVRPGASAGSYTNLSPLQPITSTPYALFAHSGNEGPPGPTGPQGPQGVQGDSGLPGVPWSLNGSTAYYNGGQVGIGTASPGAKLHVQDDTSTIVLSAHSSATSGTHYGVLSDVDSSSSYAGYFNGGRNYFSGNVGIGTASPGAKLQVEDDTSSTIVSAHSTATSGLHIGVSSAVDSSSSYAGYFVGGRNHFGGNVGVGVLNPTVKLHVYSGTDASLAEGSGTLQVGAYYENNLIMDGNEIMARNSGAAGNLHLNAHGGNVTIGTSSGGSAHLITPVIQITGGSDLSEQFDVDGEDIKPGTVVCIDPGQPGNLVTSTRSYDRTVAGIISGAGGVQTGMLMGQQGSIANGQHPVALTGRVYVLCDTATGTIEPGDLLTSSDTPGHAMKAADHSRAQGAILGKAMSSLESGKGLVLVLVTLQ